MTSFAIAPTPPTAQCSSVVANDGPLKLQQLPRTTTSPRRHSSTIPMASIFGQEPPPPSASSKAVMALLSGTGTGTSLHAVKRKRSKYILRHDYRNSSHGIISNPSKPTMIPLTELFTRSIVWILFDSLTNNEYQDNNTPSSDDSSSRVPLLPSTSQEVNNSNQQDGLPLVPLLPLPIWPGLNTLLPPVSPESPESDFPSSQFLDLLGLFEIHPIASAIASYLYGHDLRNLRLLNSDFRNLISLGTSEAGYPLYFQVLLMKTLSCPRKGTDTEPIGRPCEDTGGNVGPCILCSTIVCSTCVSPEVWTTKRYRYICPRCCGSSSKDLCRCQEHPWLCRPCYRKNWIKDLEYNAITWFSEATANCMFCNGKYSCDTDSRLPKHSVKGIREFKKWLKQSRITTADPRVEGNRRPAGCGWCKKRVNPLREGWSMRPSMVTRYRSLSMF